MDVHTDRRIGSGISARGFWPGAALAVACLLAGLVAAPMGASASRAPATSPGYTFTPLVFLGDAAPGRGDFTFDFEPSAVNDRDQVAFTADLTTGGEGVFLGRRGKILTIARAGQAAPRGGIFSAGELGRIGLNEGGDASFAFTLEPPTPPPTGLFSGVYRYSHETRTLSAVIRPGDHAPGGGTFQGAWFNTAINRRGEIVFSGIVNDSTGLFLAPAHGAITSVVRPGDAAPGGQRFDTAVNGWINEAGDIAFGGHIAGEECVSLSVHPLVCGESVYLRNAHSHAIQSIAHQGNPSPCGAKPYRLAFGPVLNDRGDVVFIGDLTPPPDEFRVAGVFLFSNGSTIPVKCPGDPMPGGGSMVSAGSQDATYSVNQTGEVSFAALLNTDANHDGFPDSGVYIVSNATTHVVARTGTVLPGIGTVATVGLASTDLTTPPNAQTGGVINEHGDVLLAVTLSNGKVVLLLATPNGERDESQDSG